MPPMNQRVTKTAISSTHTAKMVEKQAMRRAGQSNGTAMMNDRPMA